MAKFYSRFLLLRTFFQTSQARRRFMPSGISSEPTSSIKNKIADSSNNLIIGTSLEVNDLLKEQMHLLGALEFAKNCL